MVYVRIRGNDWRYKLYIQPLGFKEKFVVYLRGYRPCKEGLLNYLGWYCNKKHENK